MGAVRGSGRCDSARTAAVSRPLLVGVEVVLELGDVPAPREILGLAEKARQTVLLVLQIAGGERNDLDRHGGESEREQPGLYGRSRLLDTGDLLRASLGEHSSGQPLDAGGEEELARGEPVGVVLLKLGQGLGGERAAVQLPMLERPGECQSPVFAEPYEWAAVSRLSKRILARHSWVALGAARVVSVPRPTLAVRHAVRLLQVARRDPSICHE